MSIKQFTKYYYGFDVSDSEITTIEVYLNTKKYSLGEAVFKILSTNPNFKYHFIVQ